MSGSLLAGLDALLGTMQRERTAQSAAAGDDGAGPADSGAGEEVHGVHADGGTCGDAHCCSSSSSSSNNDLTKAEQDVLDGLDDLELDRRMAAGGEEAEGARRAKALYDDELLAELESLLREEDDCLSGKQVQ